jgi:hypothetical protein
MVRRRSPPEGAVVAGTLTGTGRSIASALALSPLWQRVTAAALAASAVFYSHRQPPESSEWTAVVLWAIGLALWFYACRTPAAEAPARPRLVGRDFVALAVIGVVACAVFLPALERYPVEVAGDPARDALLAQWIREGTTKRIFDWVHNNFSMVVPLTTLPFHFVFGASSLSFKVQAATLGAATPLLLFLLVRRYLSITNAVAAALLLIAMPVYIFYARREPVVAFNPFWMVVILFALLRSIEQGSKARTLGALGALAGLLVHFHAASKAAGFVALVLAIATAGWRACVGRQSWRRLAAAGVATSVGFAIGLGPLVLKLDLTTLISRGRMSEVGAGFELLPLLDAYARSLRVFFDQPTTSWFPIHQPLIPSPILAALFALGGGLGFIALPRRIHATLIAVTLVLLFTNSAMTDIVNGDHRLSVLLPVTTWLMATGLELVSRAAARLLPILATRATRAAAAALVAWIASDQIYRFFRDEQARNPVVLINYMVYFALREIAGTPALAKAPELCLSGNGWATEQLGLMHIREGMQYYLPHQAVRIGPVRAEADANELFVSPSCESSSPATAWHESHFCSPREPFVCPTALDTGFDDLRIHIDRGPLSRAPLEQGQPAPTAVPDSPG